MWCSAAAAVGDVSSAFYTGPVVDIRHIQYIQYLYIGYPSVLISSPDTLCVVFTWNRSFYPTTSVHPVSLWPLKSTYIYLEVYLADVQSLRTTSILRASYTGTAAHQRNNGPSATRAMLFLLDFSCVLYGKGVIFISAFLSYVTHIPPVLFLKSLSNWPKVDWSTMSVDTYW